MKSRFDKRHLETWEEMRDRLIAETSFYLTEALQHPELAVRIPTIPAGTGEFPASMSHAFWANVLDE